MEVKVHEAKTHLSRLLQRVEAGEEITIARGDTPIARLMPLAIQRKQMQGMDRGKVWIAEDFDAPDPELEALFERSPLTTPSRPKARRRKP
jgi:prevent-host-death family protein